MQEKTEASGQKSIADQLDKESLLIDIVNWCVAPVFVKVVPERG